MSKIIKLTIALLLLTACQHKSPYVATITGYTLVAMPSYYRDIGYDSIQLYVSDGKIHTNFCYPNDLRYKKDTVWTGDSAYRRFSLIWHITSTVWLAFSGNTDLSLNSIAVGPDGGTVYYFDGYKISVNKMPADTSKSSLYHNITFSSK